MLLDPLTPEYSYPHSEHAVDQRSFLQAIDNESSNKNLINHGQVGRRYDIKFVTCGLESLRKSIGGTRYRS
ncbi:hypothetical protein CR513_24923, partial [Mucuna pruriens]